MIVPFTPNKAGTVSVSASTSSGSVSLGSTVRHQVRVHNAGTGLVFVEFGTSAVTAATTTGIPLAAGATEVFTVSQTDTHMAAITASGTATVYATPGLGV